MSGSLVYLIAGGADDAAANPTPTVTILRVQRGLSRNNVSKFEKTNQLIKRRN